MTAGPTASLQRHLRQLALTQSTAALPDGELVQRFAASRDEHAFNALLCRHGPMVLRVCRRVLPGEQDAEDVFQATFLVLARSAASLRSQASVASWLYGVAHRLALKARARAARRRDREACATAAQPPEPVEEAAFREAEAILHEELSRLSDRYRLPLVLCCLEGKTRDEAAAALGWSLAKLKSRLEDARALLRRRLTRRGLTLSTALSAALLTAPAAPAVLPPLLLAATLRTARVFLAGTNASQAAALALGLLRTLTLMKLKVAAIFASVLVLVTVGAGWLLQQDPARSAQGVPKAATRAADRPKAAQDGAAPRTDRLGDPLPPGALARLGSLRFHHGRALDGVVSFGPGDKVFLSADGKHIATRTEAGPYVWDALSGREIPVPPALRRAGGFLERNEQIPEVFSAGGKLLALERSGQKVRLWDLVTGKPAHELALTGRARRFGLAPDGKTLFWGEGYPQAVFCALDVATGKAAEPIPLARALIDLTYAFSADSKTLAVQLSDRTIQVWDLPQRKLRCATKLAKTDERPLLLALSPDGTTLATAVKWRLGVRLWNARTLAELAPLPVEAKAVQSLTFAPDGRHLAVIHYPATEVGLWNLRTRKEVRQIRGESIFVVGAAFSPDGKRIALADGGEVSVREVATGAPCHDFGHTAVIDALAFSPDGKTLATGARYPDFVVRLWDPLTGKQRGQCRGHTGAVCATAFAPDGRLLATASLDGTVRLWEPATGKELRRLEAKDGSVHALAFAPDGKTLASGGKRRAIHLWDPASGVELRSFGDLGKSVWHLAFAPDGKTLAALGWGDKSVRLWDVAGGMELRRIAGQQNAIDGIAYAPAGRWLATGGIDGTVRLWDPATGQELRRLVMPRGPAGQGLGEVSYLTVSPDGRSLAARCGDGPIRVWEVLSGQERAQFEGHRGGASRLAFSRDGRLLASGGFDRTVLVWDLAGRLAGDRKPDSRPTLP